MPDSKAKIVKQQIIARCETISIANGYTADVAKVRDRYLHASKVLEYPEIQCFVVNDEWFEAQEKFGCGDHYSIAFACRLIIESTSEEPLLDLQADLKFAIEKTVAGVYLTKPWIKQVKVLSNDMWAASDEVRNVDVHISVAAVRVDVANESGNPYAP